MLLALHAVMAERDIEWDKTNKELDDLKEYKVSAASFRLLLCCKSPYTISKLDLFIRASSGMLYQTCFAM